MSQFVKFKQAIYQNPTQFTVTDVSGDTKDIKPNFGNEIQKGTPYTATLFNEITRQISYTVKDLGTGGANSYIVKLDGLAQGDLKDNLKVILVPQANNTGACTITFNGLGVNPISIKKGNADLKDADIIANQHAILNYNETTSSFELLNPQSGAEKVDIIQQQVDDLKDIVYTKPSAQMVLEAEEVKSASIEVSSLINPKYEGAFRQNLIDTHKCVYRIDGDGSSPLPIDITDSSMKIIANGNTFVGTGCFIGVVTGNTYTIKLTSVDPSSVGVLDADGLTRSNFKDKQIVYSTNKTTHDFKFKAPSSKYVFIRFTKYGSDTSGTIVSNPICIEGDYTGEDIEWVKGTQPSLPIANVSGENLYHFGDINQDSMPNYDEKGSVFVSIPIKKNTVYSWKAFNLNLKEEPRFFLIFTDFSAEGYSAKDIVNKGYIQKELNVSNSVNSDNYTYVNFVSYRRADDTGSICGDIVFKEGTTAPNEYIPPKHSQFKLNDWLGDDETYENGYVNKSWGRVLLSEAWDGDFAESSIDLGNVYRYHINIKENYTGHSETGAIESYFKDFIYSGNYSSNIKHQYFYYNESLNINRFLIFIPKAEIDTLTGSTLNEKFKNWIKLNDDYIYYKKANTKTIKSNASSLAGTFSDETNTFTNGSFGKATFNYQNSVIDSLNALSSSINALNTDEIVKDYIYRINQANVVLKGQTISQSGWIYDSVNSEYYYEFESALVDPSKYVKVNFDRQSYNNARVVKEVESDYGKVILYARKQPVSDLTAEIIITKVGG